MKKTICILCALTVLAALCGTASCEQTGPDLYHIGLEVTGLMGEIAGNEAYLSAFGRPETWTEVREAADTGDYDQPTAVYSVRLEDAEGYVREMFAADDETRELWENLPEELTQQLLYRVTPATFCNGERQGGNRQHLLRQRRDSGDPEQRTDRGRNGQLPVHV